MINAGSKQAIVGAKVMIDQGGAGKLLTSDALGTATFTGMTPGVHDFHVFHDSYTWQSIYQLDSTNPIISLMNFSVPGGAGGAIDLYANVSNLTVPAVGETVIVNVALIDAKNRVISGVVSAGSVSLNAWSLNPGTTVTGDLIATEQLCKGTICSVVDRISLGVVTYNTTSARGANTFVGTHNIVFNAVKPVSTVLFTPTVLTVPAGLAVDSLGAVEASGLEIVNVLSPLLLQPLTGLYTGGNNVRIKSSASDPYAGSWSFAKTVPVGSTAAISPAIPAMPAILTTSGNTIAWSNPLNVEGVQSLNFSNVSRSLEWQILVPKNISQIVLPTAPQGLLPALVVGNGYNLRIDQDIWMGQSYSTMVNTWAEVFSIDAWKSFDNEYVVTPSVVYTH